MKDTLHYLDTVKLHAPNFESDIDGGRGSHTTTDQDMLFGPKASSPTEHNHVNYWFPPLLSNRPTPVSGHICPHSISIYANPSKEHDHHQE